MFVDDETFFAWLDGELPDGEAARVAAAVAGDPALTERAAAHRALKQRLAGAFAPLMGAPVPVQVGAAPVDFAAARQAREGRRHLPAGLPQWAAIAASLVIGVGLGTVAAPQQDDAPIAIEGGQLVAAAGLEQALDTQLASLPQDSANGRIGLSFRARDGSLCRSFSAAAGASGLACRDGQQWRVRGLFGSAEGQGGDYRMAAGEDPRLADLIAETIDGEPFDATAERAARDKGWR